MNTFNIKIDGRDYDAREGETILTVAERNGIKIPTLCFLKDTIPYTSCYICVVEIKGRANLAPACSTAALPFLEVTTDSPRIKESRKTSLELLFSDHLGDCLAPCQSACPAGCDIPGFINYLQNNDIENAIRLIKETIPLPASLGRVCPKPCEDACRRGALDSPISICFLKRYIADEEKRSGKVYIPKTAPNTGKKVAIIGGGPAGLSTAFYLRRLGHDVTIFDSHPKAGGMLRYGIPAYRLPREVLDSEIDVIAKMGVHFEQNKFYGNDFDLRSLKDNGFDAIFLAIGAQKASSMGVPGEEDGGILSGIEFLNDVSNGVKIEIGDKVVVIGGGNTAIDAARTSLRLGAKEVIILYRRTRNELPANELEIIEAEREGVKFNYLAAPISMTRTGKVIQLDCTKMELGEPDASGRRRPIPVRGSEFIIQTPTVISAIGQAVDISYGDLKDLGLTKWKTISAKKNTFETNISGVFAGGDCVTGADIAVTAVGAGRKAAATIDQFLKGINTTGIPIMFDSKMGKLDELPPEIFEGKTKADREKMPELEVSERLSGFNEVELGFDKDAAVKEAKRCLACGCSSAEECKLRIFATEYKIDADKYKGVRRRFYTDDTHPKIFFESHKCILCGNCIRYLAEVKKLDGLGFVNRGFETVVRPPLSQTLAESCPTIGEELAEICPSGAISKKGRFKVVPRS